MPPDEDISPYQHNSSLLLEDTKSPLQQQSMLPSPSILLPRPSNKRTYRDYSQQQVSLSNSPTGVPLGTDPDYTPQRRRRVASKIYKKAR